MRIPNGEKAVVDPAKLVDYCLNSEHPRGRHKARVFLSALGMSKNDAEGLRRALLQAAEFEDAVVGTEDDFGKRYVIDFQMEHDGRTAPVRSTWIVRIDEDFPRLTSCYIL